VDFEVENQETYFLAKPYSRRTLLAKIEEMLAPVGLARAAAQAG
jgi:hypothetical protein